LQHIFYKGGGSGYIRLEDWNAYIAYKGAMNTYERELAIYNAKIASLDTGGYTGSWGTDGKLAMLHQKELVLNPDDTTNFLASLEILREIMNVIDLHSAHA
jgi:hypothetical protein